MNTAGNAASAPSPVVFGRLVGYSGDYNMPFLPMVALLCVGALLWLQVDPANCSPMYSPPDQSRSLRLRWLAVEPSARTELIDSPHSGTVFLL